MAGSSPFSITARKRGIAISAFGRSDRSGKGRKPTLSRRPPGPVRLEPNTLPMKTFALLSTLALALTLGSGRLHAAELNQLSSAEKKDGWKLLFDGHSTEGWRGYGRDSFPAKGWKVEDGLLKKVAGEQGGD